jgi:Xaa-Pro aminopeptidase
MTLLNHERALGLMKEHSVDAIIGTTNENVTYLSGHQGWVQRAYHSRQNIALLTVDPEVAVDLVLNGGDLTYFAARGGNVSRALGYGGKAGLLRSHDGFQPSDEDRAYLDLYETSGQYRTAVAALSALMRDRGLHKARIAFDEEGCDPSVLRALREEFASVEFVPATSLMLMIRLVKTPEEIELLRRAAEINRDAFEAMFAAMRPGVSESELAEIWRAEVARPGARWHWLHLGTGARSAWVFPPTERQLQTGDLFLCDAGITYHGYNADTGTSGSIGAPSPEAMREFKAVETGTQAALDICREGVTGGNIFRTLVETVRAEGIPDYNVNFAGHTIGLEPREFPFMLAPEAKYNDPFLPPSSELPLPVNSVINVESPIGRLGWGGYHIEYTIIITAEGYEEIVEQEHGFRQIEA